MHAAQNRGRSRRTRLVVLVVLLGLWSSYLVLTRLLVSAVEPAVLGSSLTKAGPGLPSYHDYKSAYSFDLGGGGVAVHPEWMRRIPDGASLASLSIPGSHDTATYDLADNAVFQCQNHDLRTQLMAGLRYFDIRGRLLIKDDDDDDDDDDDEKPVPAIGIFHGHVYTGYTLQDALLTVFAFLDQYPTEGVLMRIKEEGGPVRVGPNGSLDDHDGGGNRTHGSSSDSSSNSSSSSSSSTTTFERAFNHYRLSNRLTGPGCARHLLMGWGRGQDGCVLPRMGQLRGRVLILQEFAAEQGGPYGLEWTSAQIRLEDLWILPDLAHLDLKWRAVRASLEQAAASSDTADLLFLTHLSASVGVLPIEAAAGPSAPVNGSVIAGINDRTGAFLHHGDALTTGPPGNTGVVIADFPGQRLVTAVLRRNERLIGGVLDIQINLF